MYVEKSLAWLPAAFSKHFTNIGQNISDSVVTVDKSPETYIPDYQADKPKFNLGNTGPIHIQYMTL